MNGRILAHLIRAGKDSRIGQRGDSNPVALFNHYDRLAADAADNLRQLVDQTYGDQAETVKAIIRDRLEVADLPEANEHSTLAEAITALEALAEFYDQVAGEIRAGTFTIPEADEPATIYERAKATIEGARQWPSGDAAIIWEGKHSRVFIKEFNGLLSLNAQNGKPGAIERTRCGYLNPADGWHFDLTRAGYDRWAERAKRLMSA